MRPRAAPEVPQHPDLFFLCSPSSCAEASGPPGPAEECADAGSVDSNPSPAHTALSVSGQCPHVGLLGLTLGHPVPPVHAPAAPSTCTRAIFPSVVSLAAGLKEVLAKRTAARCRHLAQNLYLPPTQVHSCPPVRHPAAHCVAHSQLSPATCWCRLAHSSPAAVSRAARWLPEGPSLQEEEQRGACGGTPGEHHSWGQEVPLRGWKWGQRRGWGMGFHWDTGEEAKEEDGEGP